MQNMQYKYFNNWPLAAYLKWPGAGGGGGGPPPLKKTNSPNKNFF